MYRDVYIHYKHFFHCWGRIQFIHNYENREHRCGIGTFAFRLCSERTMRMAVNHMSHCGKDKHGKYAETATVALCWLCGHDGIAFSASINSHLLSYALCGQIEWRQATKKKTTTTTTANSILMLSKRQLKKIGRIGWAREIAANSINELIDHN